MAAGGRTESGRMSAGRAEGPGGGAKYFRIGAEIPTKLSIINQKIPANKTLPLAKSTHGLQGADSTPVKETSIVQRQERKEKKENY